MSTSVKWKLLPGTYEGGSQRKVVRTDDNDSAYVMIGGEDRDTNAADIVQACNAFPDLLAAETGRGA